MFLAPFAFKQQREACARMFGKRFFALYSDLGTGKSYMLLRDFFTMWLAGKVDGLLIIAPSGMHTQWVDEQVGKITDEPCDVASWPARPPMHDKGKPRIYTVYPEAFRRKLKRLRPKGDGKRRKPREDKLNILKDYLNSGRIGIIIDESQMIMTPGSNTTKRTKELKTLAAYRRIASGNPAPTGLHQYFSQYSWLSTNILGVKTKKDFDQRYVTYVNKKFGGPHSRPVPTMAGYRNEADFYKRVAPYTFTVPIEACVDMSKRAWDTITVPLTPQQAKLISQIKSEFRAQLAGSTVLMPLALQRITRIQQVACGFLPINLNEDAEGDPWIEMVQVPEQRTMALEAALADMKGKVIIWSRFSPCIERLTKHFNKLARRDKRFGTAVKYRGGISNDERKAAKKRFLEDPKCLYMFAQPQSAGTGVDGLQAVCSKSLYWSNGFNSQHRLQSERRTWRLGQKNPCLYVDLLAKGTFDDRILKTLKEKQTMSKAILGDIAGWRKSSQ